MTRTPGRLLQWQRICSTRCFSIPLVQLHVGLLFNLSSENSYVTRQLKVLVLVIQLGLPACIQGGHSHIWCAHFNDSSVMSITANRSLQFERKSMTDRNNYGLGEMEDQWKWVILSSHTCCSGRFTYTVKMKGNFKLGYSKSRSKAICWRQYQ